LKRHASHLICFSCTHETWNFAHSSATLRVLSSPANAACTPSSRTGLVLFSGGVLFTRVYNSIHSQLTARSHASLGAASGLGVLLSQVRVRAALTAPTRPYAQLAHATGADTHLSSPALLAHPLRTDWRCSQVWYCSPECSTEHFTKKGKRLHAICGQGASSSSSSSSPASSASPSASTTPSPSAPPSPSPTGRTRVVSPAEGLQDKYPRVTLLTQLRRVSSV
jgi:hypothetical protein